MKKFTLSLIAIIAMSLSASAQNSFGLKLTYEALVQFDKDSKLVGFRMQEKR